MFIIGLYRWPCGLRRTSEAAVWLGLPVRIPPWAWIFSCVCCVSRRWRPLRRADHSFRGVLLGVYCVCVCDFETSKMRIWAPSCVTEKNCFVVFNFPRQQWLRERASVLRYTYIAFLFRFPNNYFLRFSACRPTHNLEGQSIVFITPVTGWLSYTPWQWGTHFCHLLRHA